MGFFSKLNEKALKYCEESEQPQKKHLKFDDDPNVLHVIGNLTNLYGDPNLDRILAGCAPTLTGMISDLYDNQEKYQQYNELEGRYNELQKHYDELQKRYDELVKAMANNQSTITQR